MNVHGRVNVFESLVRVMFIRIRRLPSYYSGSKATGNRMEDTLPEVKLKIDHSY